jgi:hypothetical protein
MIVIADNLKEARWVATHLDTGTGYPDIKREEIVYLYIWTREEKTRLIKDFRWGIKENGKRLKMPDYIEISKNW